MALNHTIQRMGASRLAHLHFEAIGGWLPPLMVVVKQRQPMRINICCLVVVSLLCGCATDHFRSGHGDAGHFILQKAIAFGATPTTTNAALASTGGWRYFEDEQGAVVHMASLDYAALERFLLATFGQPKMGPKDTPQGGKWGMYRLTPIGGCIMFGFDSVDGAHVEVIRPLSRKESSDAVVRTLKDKEVQKAIKDSP